MKRGTGRTKKEAKRRQKLTLEDEQRAKILLVSGSTLRNMAAVDGDMTLTAFSAPSRAFESLKACNARTRKGTPLFSCKIKDKAN